MGIDFDIVQLIEVDDKAFTVSFSLYMRVKWAEPRIIGKFDI